MATFCLHPPKTKTKKNKHSHELVFECVDKQFRRTMGKWRQMCNICIAAKVCAAQCVSVWIITQRAERIETSIIRATRCKIPHFVRACEMKFYLRGLFCVSSLQPALQKSVFSTTSEWKRFISLPSFLNLCLWFASHISDPTKYARPFFFCRVDLEFPVILTFSWHLTLCPRVATSVIFTAWHVWHIFCFSFILIRLFNSRSAGWGHIPPLAKNRTHPPLQLMPRALEEKTSIKYGCILAAFVTPRMGGVCLQSKK